MYFRLRGSAYYFASIERQFGTPDGRAADDSIFQILNELLPINPAEWFGQGAARAESVAQSSEHELAEAIMYLYQENFFRYLAWLDDLGILASGEFSKAMLSGQAFATLVSLARHDSSNGSIMQRIGSLQRCFFPFCE